QTVTVTTEDQKQYVVIEPTSPSEIYVPYYEPAVVYGDWPYPDYAPYYFPPPPGYLAGGVLATGVAAALAQVIVTGPPQAIAIGTAGVIETGRKLATPGVAKTQAKGGRARRARNRARRLVRRQARRRASSGVRRQASSRASRSATPLFQMSNRALRLA